MVVDSLDDEEPEQHFDILGFQGKGTVNHSSQPNDHNKVQIMVEGTIDSGASNSVAPIEAAPGVK
eukprot:6028555-Heterocapsa_arctica.AAC.1